MVAQSNLPRARSNLPREPRARGRSVRLAGSSLRGARRAPGRSGSTARFVVLGPSSCYSHPEGLDPSSHTGGPSPAQLGSLPLGQTGDAPLAEQPS